MQQMRITLLAVTLSATLCAAGPVLLRAQSRGAAPAPPQAVVPARPAPLDAAAVERKVDELLNAHVKVNEFSGTVLLASGGKPLVAKGYGYANVEWQIPNTTKTKFRIGSARGFGLRVCDAVS